MLQYGNFCERPLSRLLLDFYVYINMNYLTINVRNCRIRR